MSEPLFDEYVGVALLLRPSPTGLSREQDITWGVVVPNYPQTQSQH